MWQEFKLSPATPVVLIVNYCVFFRISIPFTSRWSSIAITRQRLPSISRVSTKSERSGLTLTITSGVSIWKVFVLAILEASNVFFYPTVSVKVSSKFSSFSSGIPLRSRSRFTSGLESSSGSGDSFVSCSISLRLS